MENTITVTYSDPSGEVK